MARVDAEIGKLERLAAAEVAAVNRLASGWRSRRRVAVLVSLKRRTKLHAAACDCSNLL
jgi:hypothetical protein